MLSRFDADHSGDLSFEEYLALMAVWVEEDETQIIEAFKVTHKPTDKHGYKQTNMQDTKKHVIHKFILGSIVVLVVLL